MAGQSLDDLHGATTVASISIRMTRDGACRVEGSITDHAFACFLLDTARDVVNNYHNRAKMMDGKAIIVPAYDTALVGTPEEKKLLAARHELADAM
jgi:hypothetical protein